MTAHVNDGWLKMHQGLPPDLPIQQVDNMRLAFFAGACHLFSVLMPEDDNGQDPEQDAVFLQIFKDLETEMRSFRNDVLTRVLARAEGAS